jgi:phage baseplate assembly protein W
MEYVKIPLNFSRFFEGAGHLFDRCSEKESIDQHLELLLTTMPGEHRFDENYGCRIWELDFERIESGGKWEAKFRGYILDAVTTYERRVKDVEVRMSVRDWIREDALTRNQSVRKRVDVSILGTLVSTGEKCGFGYSLYLGPLSNE